MPGPDPGVPAGYVFRQKEDALGETREALRGLDNARVDVNQCACDYFATLANSYMARGDVKGVETVVEIIKQSFPANEIPLTFDSVVVRPRRTLDVAEVHLLLAVLSSKLGDYEKVEFYSKYAIGLTDFLFEMIRKIKRANKRLEMDEIKYLSGMYDIDRIWYDKVVHVSCTAREILGCEQARRNALRMEAVIAEEVAAFNVKLTKAFAEAFEGLKSELREKEIDRMIRTRNRWAKGRRLLRAVRKAIQLRRGVAPGDGDGPGHAHVEKNKGGNRKPTAGPGPGGVEEQKSEAAEDVAEVATAEQSTVVEDRAAEKTFSEVEVQGGADKSAPEGAVAAEAAAAPAPAAEEKIVGDAEPEPAGTTTAAEPAPEGGETVVTEAPAAGAEAPTPAPEATGAEVAPGDDASAAAPPADEQAPADVVAGRADEPSQQEGLHESLPVAGTDSPEAEADGVPAEAGASAPAEEDSAAVDKEQAPADAPAAAVPEAEGQHEADAATSGGEEQGGAVGGGEDTAEKAPPLSATVKFSETEDVLEIPSGGGEAPEDKTTPTKEKSILHAPIIGSREDAEVDNNTRELTDPENIQGSGLRQNEQFSGEFLVKQLGRAGTLAALTADVEVGEQAQSEDGEVLDEFDFDLTNTETAARDGLGMLLDEVRDPALKKEYVFEEDPEREVYESFSEDSSEESLDVDILAKIAGDGDGDAQEKAREPTKEDELEALARGGGGVPYDRTWEFIEHYFRKDSMGDPRDKFEDLQLRFQKIDTELNIFLFNNCQSLADQVQSIASNWFDAPYEDPEEKKKLNRLKQMGVDVSKVPKKKIDKMALPAEKYSGAPHLAREHEKNTSRLAGIVKAQQKRIVKMITNLTLEAEREMWMMARSLLEMLMSVKIQKGPEARAKARKLLGTDNLWSPARKSQRGSQMLEGQAHDEKQGVTTSSTLTTAISNKAAAAGDPAMAPPNLETSFVGKRFSVEDIIWQNLRNQRPNSKQTVVVNVRLEPPEKGTVRPDRPPEALISPKEHLSLGIKAVQERIVTPKSKFGQSPKNKRGPHSPKSPGTTNKSPKSTDGSFGGTETGIASGTAGQHHVDPSATSPSKANATPNRTHTSGSSSSSVGASYLRALHRIRDESDNVNKGKMGGRRRVRDPAPLGLGAAQQLTLLDRFNRGEKQFVDVHKKMVGPQTIANQNHFSTTQNSSLMSVESTTAAGTMTHSSSLFHHNSSMQSTRRSGGSGQFSPRGAGANASGTNTRGLNSLQTTTAAFNRGQLSQTDGAGGPPHQQSTLSLLGGGQHSGQNSPAGHFRSSMSTTSNAFFYNPAESEFSDHDGNLFSDLEDAYDVDGSVTAPLDQQLRERMHAKKRRSLVRKNPTWTKESRRFTDLRSARSTCKPYPVFSDPVLFVPEVLKDVERMRDVRSRRKQRSYQTDGAAFGLVKYFKPRERADSKSVKGLIFQLRVSNLVTLASRKFKNKNSKENTYKTVEGVAQYLNKVELERQKLKKEKQKAVADGSHPKEDLFKKEQQTFAGNNKREMLGIFDTFRRHTRKLNNEMKLLADNLYDNTFLYSGFSYPLLRRKLIKQFEREMKLRIYMRKPSELLLVQKKLSSGFRRLKEDLLSVEMRRMMRDLGRMSDYKEYRQRKPRAELPQDPEELAAYEELFEQEPLVLAQPKMPDQKVHFVKSRADAPDPSAIYKEMMSTSKIGADAKKKLSKEEEKEMLRTRYLWREQPEPAPRFRAPIEVLTEKKKEQSVLYARDRAESVMYKANGLGKCGLSVSLDNGDCFSSAKSTLDLLREHMVPAFYKKERAAEDLAIRQLEMRLHGTRSRSRSGFFDFDFEDEEEEEEEEIDEEELKAQREEEEKKQKMIEKYGLETAEKLLKAQEVEIVEFLPKHDPREEAEYPFFSPLVNFAKKLEDGGNVSAANWKYRLTASQLMRKKAKQIMTMNKALSTDDGYDFDEGDEAMTASMTHKDSAPGSPTGKGGDRSSTGADSPKKQPQSPGRRDRRKMPKKWVREGFHRFLQKEMNVPGFKIPKDNSSKMVKLMWNIYEENYSKTLWTGVEKFGPGLIYRGLAKADDDFLAQQEAGEEFRRLMTKYGIAQGRKLRSAMGQSPLQSQQTSNPLRRSGSVVVGHRGGAGAAAAGAGAKGSPPPAGGAGGKGAAGGGGDGKEAEQNDDDDDESRANSRMDLSFRGDLLRSAKTKAPDVFAAEEGEAGEQEL